MSNGSSSSPLLLGGACGVHRTPHTVYTSATIVIRHSESKRIRLFRFFANGSARRRHAALLPSVSMQTIPFRFENEDFQVNSFDVFKQVKAVENNWRTVLDSFL